MTTNRMTTNRLYNVFGLLISLALVAAAVLATPMLVGALKVPLISNGGDAVIGNSSAAADAARLEFRRGEWSGGRDEASAAAAAGRLEFRRGEWFGGQQNVQATPTHQVVEPDYTKFLWYTK